MYMNTLSIGHRNIFVYNITELTLPSPRDQWVPSVSPGLYYLNLCDSSDHKGEMTREGHEVSIPAAMTALNPDPDLHSDG